MKIGKHHIDDEQLLIYAGVAALFFVFGPQLAKAIAQKTVSAAGEAVGGAVVGIGEQFGIPETDMTQCQADIAAGRTWESSFSCPAGSFIKSFF